MGATHWVAHRAKQRFAPTYCAGNAHFSVYLPGTHPLRVHFLCRLKSALPVRCSLLLGSAHFSVHLLGMHPLGCISLPTKVGAPGSPGTHPLECISCRRMSAFCTGKVGRLPLAVFSDLNIPPRALPSLQTPQAGKQWGVQGRRTAGKRQRRNTLPYSR